MTISFTWLGHSAFVLMIGDNQVLIDPFLTDNPLAAASPNDLNPEFILLTHAHSDHVGDTIDIARRSGATIVCNFDMGNWFFDKGLQRIQQGNPGGTFDAGFFSIKWTIAHHSSSFHDGTYGGQPNGFIITALGKKLYFAGDTALFLDMQLIGEEGIDVAFLPIGDLFTMGPDDSIKAIRFIKPRMVVPVHYNTWPPIVQDAASWADKVNRGTDAQPIVIDPGNTYTLE